jgi:hypothetical protein
MTNKVIVVDGPARGQVLETDQHRFLALDDPMLGPGPETIRQVTYHVHKFLLLGRMLRIASTRLMSEQISNVDLFEALASDKAKDAVNV